MGRLEAARRRAFFKYVGRSRFSPIAAYYKAKMWLLMVLLFMGGQQVTTRPTKK